MQNNIIKIPISMKIKIKILKGIVKPIQLFSPFFFNGLIVDSCIGEHLVGKKESIFYGR